MNPDVPYTIGNVKSISIGPRPIDYQRFTQNSINNCWTLKVRQLTIDLYCFIYHQRSINYRCEIVKLSLYFLEYLWGVGSLFFAPDVLWRKKTARITLFSWGQIYVLADALSQTDIRSVVPISVHNSESGFRYAQLLGIGPVVITFHPNMFTQNYKPFVVTALWTKGYSCRFRLTRVNTQFWIFNITN